MNEETKELMLDLQLKRALQDLTPEEEKMLADLEKTAGDNAEWLDLTVAALSLAEIDPSEQMPVHLQSKIADAAKEHFHALEGGAKQNVVAFPHGSQTSRPYMSWLGWAAAAAASVALAFNIYYTRQPANVARIEAPTPEIREQLTPDQQRQKLIETAPDIARAELAGGKGFEAVSGDAVWSDARQAGYLRFRGLPVNDVSTQTYQLWIFDETQDEKTPIDGGTFNVDRNGEVIIPINPRLAPRKPKAFAVTVEKAGGVVVSKRAKIAAIGKTSA